MPPRGKPRSKISQLTAAMRRGDWELALRIAARFPRLGEHRKAIVRAHEAYSYPSIYRQLGYDIEQLKAEGRRALTERYGK
jgi:hypothetical protein